VVLIFEQAFGTIQQFVSLILALLLAFISFFPSITELLLHLGWNQELWTMPQTLRNLLAGGSQDNVKRETEILDMNSHMSGTLFLSPLPSRRGPSV
jgi:hypothetical protein